AEPMGANSAASTSGGSPADLAPGQVIGGRFAIEGKVSEDALGAVLSARDKKTDKPIALRMLSAHIMKSEDAVKRLRDECRTAAALSHRSIVNTYGVGSAPGGRQFVACEW